MVILFFEEIFAATGNRPSSATLVFDNFSWPLAKQMHFRNFEVAKYKF
jgi:hypothetical protein